MAALPELHVSDSSEAMLSGRKPPFRLLVQAVHRKGRKLNIRHAVSEGFVVSDSWDGPDWLDQMLANTHHAPLSAPRHLISTLRRREAALWLLC